MWRSRPEGAVSSALSSLVGRLRDRSGPLALDSDIRLDGRVALVTGAEHPLGTAIATELARHGAHVLAGCREQGPRVVEAIRNGAGERCGTIEAVHLDLERFASVERLAEELDEDGVIVDTTILAHEIAPRRSSQTADGIDTMLQVNVLSSFLLVQRLSKRDVLVQTPIELDDAPSPPRPRLIALSSELHRRARMHLEQLPSQPWKAREAWNRYCHSKLLLEVWLGELRKRASEQGRAHSLAVHSVSPGPLHPADVAPEWLTTALGGLSEPWIISPEEAAQPFAYLAGAPELESDAGGYWDGRSRKPPATQVDDRAAGRTFWELAAHLTRSAA